MKQRESAREGSCNVSWLSEAAEKISLMKFRHLELRRVEGGRGKVGVVVGGCRLLPPADLAYLLRLILLRLMCASTAYLHCGRAARTLSISPEIYRLKPLMTSLNQTMWYGRH